jgi:nucleotide-binding universal stress UspA family protein
MKLERILLAVDFSHCSDGAVEHAAELARRFHAPLHVVHAVELPVVIDPPPLLEHDARHEFARARASLDELANDLERDGLPRPGETIEVGSPARVILETAERERCDLIVVGTHGRSGLRRLMIGSVAEHVIRHARCPVLTVRGRE